MVERLRFENVNVGDRVAVCFYGGYGRAMNVYRKARVVRKTHKNMWVQLDGTEKRIRYTQQLREWGRQGHSYGRDSWLVTVEHADEVMASREEDLRDAIGKVQELAEEFATFTGRWSPEDGSPKKKAALDRLEALRRAVFAVRQGEAP